MFKIINNFFNVKYFNQNLFNKNNWFKTIITQTQLSINHEIFQGIPKCLLKYIGIIHWYIEKLKVNKKNEIKNNQISLCLKKFKIFQNGLNFNFFSTVWWFVSFKKNIIIKISIKLNAVKNQNGAFTHHIVINKDQISGHIIKQSQNNHQIIHILDILSFLSFEISQSIAWIILIFPHEIQAIILQIKNTKNIGLKVITRFAIKAQIIHKSNIFFLQ